MAKRPLLALPVDGYPFHREGTRQHERDERKDSILRRYNLPLLRFATNGSREKERLIEALKKRMPNKFPTDGHGEK